MSKARPQITVHQPGQLPVIKGQTLALNFALENMHLFDANGQVIVQPGGPMRDRIGLAVVGLGMAAKPHALALQDLADQIDVRGCYARSAEARAAFCQNLRLSTGRRY
jgi:hypothetical protein